MKSHNEINKGLFLVVDFLPTRILFFRLEHKEHDHELRNQLQNKLRAFHACRFEQQPEPRACGAKA